MRRYTLYIISAGLLLSFAAACNKQRTGFVGHISIYNTDTALKLVNGTWLYKNIRFTGHIKELYPNDSLKTNMLLRDGKQDGLTTSFYPDGKPESVRWYKQGEKDSINTGWWQNGNKRFEYHFDKGNYNGLFTEWYSDSKILRQIFYNEGIATSGKGWRENGELYMNFVVMNGRYYGLMNSNLCYSLSKEAIK